MKREKKPRRQTGGSLAPLLHPAGTPHMDYVLLAIVLTLVVFGLVMLFSSSYAVSYYQYQNSFHYISSQFKYALFGGVVMLAASRFNYKWLKVACWPLYAFTILLLVAVFAFTVDGVEEYHRWIVLGGSTFQPSEIAKFSIAVTCSWLAVKNQSKIRSRNYWENFRYGVLVFLLALAPMAVLIYKEPHVSATIIMVCITAAIMFSSGTNWLWCGLALGGAGAAISMVTVFTKYLPEHAQKRIESWHNPFASALGDGMQTVQGLYAIGSGGVKGLGIGNSRQKHLWVPEPYNDFIFSIAAEELGFIGALLILALFAALIIRGYWVASRCRDRFGSLLATGITTQVAVQAFFNIGVVTNFLPNTGISLPFFSYGGTSLLMLLGEMGILLSISRTPREKKEEAPAAPGDPAPGQPSVQGGVLT